MAFNFGKSQGYSKSNPVDNLLKKDVEASPIEVFTPEEARKLLSACDREALPYFALGLFCGIRPTELTRLEWESVRFDKGYVVVKSSVSKKGRKRHVDLSDNLITILKTYQTAEGFVTPQRDWRRKMRDIQAATKWQKNILRHSFASYYLAYHGDLNRLALVMGHTSTRTSFEHYLDVVEKADAIRFWKIGLDCGVNGKRAVA
ncbi:MAG: tyrosine-type recombinase/integrase [Verrucomicrobiota bacterium]